MQQSEIKYRGMSTSPSDYLAPDGDTALCQNMIVEGGELRPFLPPKVVFQIPGAGFTPEVGTINGAGRFHIVHQIDTREIFIIGYEYLRQGSFTYGLFAFQLEDGALKYLYPVLADIEKPITMTIIGQVLAVATPSAVKYVRWDGKYIELANPLQLNLAFGLDMAMRLKPNTLIFEKYHSASDFVNGIMPEDGNAITSQQHNVSEDFWGDFLKGVAEEKKEGRFTHPFFVRYAFRMNTTAGSHTLQSAPILMMPTSRPMAYVYYVNDDEQKEENRLVSYKIVMPSGKLFYSLQHSVDDIQHFIDSWGDIITKVDVFISAPIYTEKQSEGVYNCEVVSDEADRRLALINGGNEVLRFHDIYTTFGQNTLDPNMNLAYTNTDANGESWPSRYIKIPTYDEAEMQRKYSDASLFYLAATLDIKDDLLVQLEKTTIENNMGSNEVVTTSNITLEIPFETLDTLQQREVLADDYDSHCARAAETVFAYNARLYLANVSRGLFPGYAPRTLFMQRKEFDSAVQSTYTVYTFFKMKGEEYVVKTTSTTPYNCCVEYLPYLYVPDANATKVLIVATGASSWIKKFPLTRHNYLNGAYYFNKLYLGFGEDGTAADIPDDSDVSQEVMIVEENKLLGSEVNNPFLFPLASRETIGFGRIKALASVSVALSQGQFGDFPMYALTDEGTWALSISPEGKIAAKQPATADVINDGETLLQANKSLSFTTDVGLMVLSGAQSTNITSILDHAPLELSKIAHLKEILPNAVEIASIRSFLSGCRMAYDYARMRLFVCNDKYSYTLVFSLEDQQWALWPKGLAYSINKFPTSYMADRYGRVYDLSMEDDESPVDCAVISRPMKLGLPDSLKTITTAIHRANKELKVALFGSVDGLEYHYIASSTTKNLRGLHGSPYKYFIFAFGGALRKGDSVTSASVLFQEKRTNKLR